MPDISVIAAATTTPVGLDTQQTAASVRAGITRYRSFHLNGRAFRGFTVSAVPDDRLTSSDIPGLSPLEHRLVALARSTRDQLPCHALPGTPLILGLPNGTAFKGYSDEKILGLFAPCLTTGGTTPDCLVFRSGRASGLLAIQSACEILTSGKAHQVLAGGVDTYNDPDILGLLNIQARNMSQSQVNNDGFIPGEGAGFLLLMLEPEARRRKLPSLGTIRAWASGFEKGHFGSQAPYLGNGLSETFRVLLSSRQQDPVRTVFTTLNGESYWAKEWGTVYLRSRNAFDPDLAIHHPAVESYGDPGAASGPIMAAIALTAIRNGHCQGPALAYTSSDRGERCAIIVS